MRIHLLAPVPHRDTVVDWEPCAYTGKILRLASMLTAYDHHVILYGGPHNDARVAEHVAVISADDRARWFGDERYVERVFDRWNVTDPCWVETNDATIAAISERFEHGDIIGITAGYCHAPVAEAFRTPGLVAEVGIGYEAPLPWTHWCVESESWRHWLYGKYGFTSGRMFDTVINHFFDPADYDVHRGSYRDDYLLFMGRMMDRKGLAVVAELAKHHRVITAGPGDERVPGAEHVGVVKGAEKARLLARARALISYSLYVEPFGGVAAEAQLCGVPVIASPFGAYTETVRHGETGFLCHTLAGVLAAAKNVDRLDERKIREWALSRFTMAVAAPQYDRWLEKLATLYDKGWYQ